MKKWISGILFFGLIVVIVLYAAGVFRGEVVEPGKVDPHPGHEAPTRTVQAEKATVEVWEDAVGTVESRKRVVVVAQVTARVKAVHADAGARVTAGTPLIDLDDRELAARRAQAGDGLTQAEAVKRRAEQAKAQAEAVLVQARKRFERIKGLKEANAATDEQLEIAEAGFLQAEAGVAEAVAAIAAADAQIEQAKQVVTEAEVALGHATIETPLDGVVAVKDVEPSDLAWPGKTLMEILDPDDLRLEAQVREGLIGRVTSGDELNIHLPALGRTLAGTVGEVCPTADPRSRTFRVRVDFDRIPGVHPGMFGRLRIPNGEREIVRVPVKAVRVTGQVESVLVKTPERWERLFVTTGRHLGDGTVEILSGLEGGETLGLPETE